MKFLDVELHSHRNPERAEIRRSEFEYRIGLLGGTVTASHLMVYSKTWLFRIHVDEKHLKTIAQWSSVWRISEPPKQDIGVSHGG